MHENNDPKNLHELLQRLRSAAGDHSSVSLDSMLQATGRSSYGAVLLVPGLLVLSPLSGVPGLPSVCAVMVALITLQLLIGRRCFWLPQWLLRRSASRSKYDKALGFLERLTRYIDRLLRPRLTYLTRGVAVPANALLCLAVAMTMPPLELIPFGNSLAGATLSVVGLGLIAHDGVMILIALAFFSALLFMLGRVLL